MDVQVTEAGPCRRTLKIKVPPETIKGHLDRAFQSASRQVRMKGFRSGQVPRKVLEKRFGDAIRAEAKEQIVGNCFNDAIRQHELKIVGSPDIEGIDATPIDESAPLEFTIHLDVRPEFELGDVHGIEIQAESSAVTDEDIDNALKQLADQKKTLEGIEEPVEENDFVTADLEFKDETGATVHRREGAQMNANIPIAGTEPDAFKAALIGKEKGQTFQIPMTFPDAFEVEAVRGQDGSVDATVREVRRVQAAAIDDALAAGFEFDSLDALRDELRTRIGEEKERSEKARQEGAILDIVANDHQFPLPESLVKDQVEHSLKQFRQRLEQAKLDPTEIEQKLDASRTEAQQDSERRVRLFFLLDAIARRESIKVTNEDVDAEILEIAQRHGASPDEVRAHYEEQKLMNDLQLGIVERKVRDFLRANAKITDKEPGSA